MSPPQQRPQGLGELSASVAELRERLAGLETAVRSAFQAGYDQGRWEAAAAEREALAETVEVLSDPGALADLVEVRAARERGEAPTPLPEVLAELYRRAEAELGPQQARARWAKLEHASRAAPPPE